MSITLRIILIVASLGAFLLTIKKVNQSKLKISDSISWFIGSFLLVIMSIFSNLVGMISSKLGFMAPVNFVFFIVIIFLLVQIFVYNIKISQLSEKIKELNHHIAFEEYKERNKKNGKM